MANFYLDKDQTSEIGGSKVTVNGTDGTQDRILLLASARDAVVTESVEIADFAGSLAAYTFHAVGGGVGVYRDGELVATVVPNAKTPTELRFAEGGITVAQDADTGAYTVGGWTVPGGDDTDPEAWAGEETAVNPEHKSEAGTLGPAGRGQDYYLPDALGAGNVIQSDGLSNTYYTKDEATGKDVMNGLRAGAQIVDASVEDDDLLVLNYDRLNLNGQIVNVETIEAKWDGKTDGEFDAKNVTSAAQGGTNIVVSTNRSVAKNFAVDNVKGNSVTASDGVTGTLRVNDIKGGGAMDVGQAATLALVGTGSTTVKADRNFMLDLSQGDGYATSKSKVLTIESDKDITISGRGVEDGDYIKAAGNGAITLDTSNDTGRLNGATGNGDISHLTGFKAIGVHATAPNATYTVADGQTVLFSDDANDRGATFRTDGKTFNVELDLVAADRDLGLLSIADGGRDPKKNEISRLTVDTNGHDLVIGNIVTDGSDGTKGSQEPGNDTVAFIGDKNVTIKDVSGDGAATGGGIIDASELGGRLTVGDADNAVTVGAAGHSLAIAAGMGGSDVTIGKVGAGLFFFQGGEGADKVTFKDVIADNNDINSYAATLDMGDGDDTVILDAGGLDLTTQQLMASSMNLAFGDGGKDTLQVKGSGMVDFFGHIGGLNVLNIADSAKLRMFATSFVITDGVIAPTFTLQTNGLILSHVANTPRISNITLDLSGITTESSSVKPVVTVLADLGSQPGGTVVCNTALSEKIEIKGTPARPSDIVTLKNFTAGGSADQIVFTSDTDTNLGALTQDVSSDFNAGKTLKKVQDDLQKGHYTFFKDGTDTYVIARLADGTISAVRLEGTSYTQSLLGSSVEGTVKAPTNNPGVAPVIPEFEVGTIDPKTGVAAGQDGADNQFQLDFGIDSSTTTAAKVTVDGANAHSNKVILGSSSKPVDILGCAGKDDVTLQSEVTSNITATLGDGENTVNIDAGVASGATVDIAGGNEQDTLNLKKDQVVQGTVKADLGNGGNFANLNSSIDPTGNVSVTGGDGVDTVKVENPITVEGSLTIDLGDGETNSADLSQAIIDNSAVGGTVKVIGGDGEDTVSGGTATSGTLNIATGNGRDVITLGAVTGGKVEVSAGAGDDTVILGDVSGVTAAGSVTIAAGLGRDTLQLSGGTTDLKIGVLDKITTLSGFEILDMAAEVGISGDETLLGDTKLATIDTLVNGRLTLTAGTSGITNAALGKVTTIGDENGMDTTLAIAGGSKAITLDLSDITIASGATVSIDGGSGDSLTIGELASGATVTFSGNGSNNDTVTLTSAKIEGVLNLDGSGNGAAAPSGDTLKLDGITLAELAAARDANSDITISNFEILDLGGAANIGEGDLKAISGSGITGVKDNLTINVEKGGDAFTLGSLNKLDGGNLIVNVGANATSFDLSGISNASAASETVTVNAQGALKAGTEITLSSAKDVITLNGATATSSNILALKNFTSGTDTIVAGRTTDVAAKTLTAGSIAAALAEDLAGQTNAIVGKMALINLKVNSDNYAVFGDLVSEDGVTMHLADNAVVVQLTGTSSIAIGDLVVS